MGKMTNCKSCGKEIATSAKSCPGCGAKNKKPFYKRGWFIALVIVFILGAIGSSGGNDTSTTEASNETTVESSNDKKSNTKEKFEIVGEDSMENDGFATYINGIIKNNSGKECSYVQVTYKLYDKDGNQVGTAIANVNNLEKDGTWKFKAIGTDIDGQVSSYKLAEITGY